MPRPATDAVLAVDLDYDGDRQGQIERLYERAVAAVERGDGIHPPRTLDAMPDDWASEAGLSFTATRVDVPRVLDQVAADLGANDDVRVLRALLERVELSASAEDGDILVDAELRWAG